MSLSDSIKNFTEGLKSVIDVSGLIQSTISDSISNGVEHAFQKIRNPIEQSLIRVTTLAISLFFIIWGLSQFIDCFMPYTGLGFVIIGGTFGILTLLLFREKEIIKTK